LNGALDPAQLIAHVRHARHRLGDVFSAALLRATGNEPGERYHAVVHAHFDVARVNVPIIRQTFVYVFADALVGTPVAARAAPRIPPPTHLAHKPKPSLGLLISEPRSDLVADTLKEAAMLGAAPVWAAVVALTVSALSVAEVIRFARTIAVIVIAVRLVVITAVAAAAMRQIVIRPSVAVVIWFLMDLAPASVTRLVVIIQARAIVPVIMAVHHLAPSKSQSAP
jgi:hypothetical protein